jgi:predicted Zn finger-like uncharacterized protein
MAIEFSCPACGNTLRVEDEAAGRVVRCGGCLTTLRVPGAAAAAPPPAPEPEPGPPRPDDDRPRPPRRRRRPPPPAGRGPLFWVALTVGVIGLGTCACCCGVALLLPGAEWRTHQSREGGYKVDLPAAPRDNLPVAGVKLDKDVKAEGAVLWSRGEVFVVVRRDLPPRNRRQQTDDQLLDEGAKGIEGDPECRRVVRTERLKVSGFTAREVEFLGRDGGTYVVRLVAAGDRLYLLAGGGRFVRPGNPNVRRFLDSFEVTDPKPRAKDRAGGD